jgi:hypothetical protein
MHNEPGPGSETNPHANRVRRSQIAWTISVWKLIAGQVSKREITAPVTYDHPDLGSRA